jgi:LacI family transcriptional regulator
VTTIKDVAEAAGVSVATVSRVLNTPAAVRPPIVDKVTQAILDLGYVPNNGARSLAGKRSRTIGAVVPTVDQTIFAKTIDALQNTLAQQGYQLLLASCGYDPAREASQILALVERGVDGLMLVGKTRRPEALAPVLTRGIPVVTTSTLEPDTAWCSVGWDNCAQMMRVANLMLQLGHRRIGMIAGRCRDNDRAAARVEGVRQAMLARGLTLDPRLVIESPYSVPAAREAMARLMQMPEPPTAVLCGNDVLAFGAVLECQWRGIDVPGQVSIAGFDDLEIASHIYPGLTTMRVPAADIGTRTAALLLAAQRGEWSPHTVQLDLELIVRGTTGPAPSLR